MEAQDLSLLISNIGLLQQTVAAFLLTILFLLLNSNKNLATRQLFLSWLWLSISLLALVIQYSSVLNLNFVTNESSSGKLFLNGLYLAGKGLFFIYLFGAVSRLCEIPKGASRLKSEYLIWGWLGLTAITVLTTSNLNHFVFLQAPLVIFLLGFSGYTLKKHYPGIGIGKNIVPVIFFLNMILWIIYLFTFPQFADSFLQYNGFHLRKLLSYNSYADLLGQMLLAFGMLIVIFEKYSKILSLANGQLEQMNSSLKKQSYLDTLTGAQNRRALEFHYNNMNFTNNTGAALIVCDLDNLKLVNDSLGHAYGDQLLITFVEHIKDSLREGDKIFRIGGDEFVVWMQGCSFILANKRFEKLLLQVPNIEKQLKGFKLCFSYGCAMIKEDSQLDEVIGDADKLMYQKKLQHKNNNT